MDTVDLIWESDEVLRINDVRFLVTFDSKKLHDIQSTEECFLLGKTHRMIERSVAMGEGQRINKVFDIGIFKGGSVVLYDQIFKPEKIAAVEVSRDPVEALSKYIATRGKTETIKLNYGVNQADRPAMEHILSIEFPERDIDLIVDDASHRYKETRASFNISYPYLKAGGWYVIEDWGWAHWAGDPWQTGSRKRAPYWGEKALSNLLIELFMLAASRPDLLEEIRITHDLIILKKGPDPLPPGAFEIADHYLLRGKRFGAWL
jgi:hypothetical protein